MKRSGTCCLLLFLLCSCSNQAGNGAGSRVPVAQQRENGQEEDRVSTNTVTGEDPERAPAAPVIEPSPFQPPAEVDPVPPPVEGTEPAAPTPTGNQPD